MSRRRRRMRNRRRKRPPNRWLIGLQIAMLVGAVLFLYAFGDQVAAGASNLLSELTEPPASSERVDTGTANETGGAPLTPPSSGYGDEAGADAGISSDRETSPQ